MYDCETELDKKYERYLQRRTVSAHGTRLSLSVGSCPANRHECVYFSRDRPRRSTSGVAAQSVRRGRPASGVAARSFKRDMGVRF